MYRVMLVDDEETITEGLKVTIDWEQNRCKVVDTSSDGDEAIRKASIVKPDIVITDIRMLNLDGLSMIEQLKDNHPRLKFIVLSGYSEFELAKRAILLGITAYLLKPIDEEELEDALTRCIQGIEQDHEHHSGEDDESALFELGENKKDVISEAKAYIQSHFASEVTLTTISEHLFINPFYLSRLFKKRTGESYLNYITKVRLEEAKKLLITTDKKIYEVAESVGYDTTKYFSKIFEKWVGCKPSDYKNKYNQQR
ncbi:response regulator [Paenibacillus sonchi]|uniref:Response regulator n=1 Tax=Paenibacillus sonchi TaxID=373687 RepID=A0A974PGU9_9BACL|nr:response regulator [Paenibacillus sonchi]QQZ63675.1 response regulator [Paenibacillus sonchi]